MRIRLAVMLTSAVLLLPVTTASAHLSSPPQPERKCPSRFILHHCD